MMCLAIAACGGRPVAPGNGGRRVVAIAPSLVEIVYALGRGDRLVGIDSFTSFPPEARRLPRVGGLVDPNFELVLSLRPDLVVIESDHERLSSRLRRAGVDTLALRCQSLGDLDRAIAALGERLDARERARSLAARIHDELAAVRSAAKDGRPVRLLYVIDRQPGAIRDVWAAGGRSFLGEIARVAGGDNVFGDVDRGALPVSTELLLASAPEVIFDATRDPAGLEPWKALGALPAVATGRLVDSSDPIFTIPGPRVPEVARRMLRVLHLSGSATPGVSSPGHARSP